MDGREFLNVAAELAQGGTEAQWRTAAGRAYYALFLEARDLLDRWGMPCPRRDNVHAFVKNTLVYSSDPDLRQVGLALERLGQTRNDADYELSDPKRLFVQPARVLERIADSRQGLAILDKIDTNDARRAAAIASVKKS